MTREELQAAMEQFVHVQVMWPGFVDNLPDEDKNNKKLRMFSMMDWRLALDALKGRDVAEFKQMYSEFDRIATALHEDAFLIYEMLGRLSKRTQIPSEHYLKTAASLIENQHHKQLRINAPYGWLPELYNVGSILQVL